MSSKLLGRRAIASAGRYTEEMARLRPGTLRLVHPNGSPAFAMAEAIAKRELPIVILEMDQQGTISEIMNAITKNYDSVIETPYRTLNTRLGVFIPKARTPVRDSNPGD